LPNGNYVRIGKLACTQKLLQLHLEKLSSRMQLKAVAGSYSKISAGWSPQRLQVLELLLLDQGSAQRDAGATHLIKDTFICCPLRVLMSCPSLRSFDK
jgi:hypothetical protein